MSTREDKKAIGTRQQPLEKKSNTIYSYKDLVVWQKSMNLVEAVYRLSFKFPATEQWGLISQMRRAAVSVPSNIAEGYGRQATGEYHHHLSIGRGSLLELETQVLLSLRLGYVGESHAQIMLRDIEEISKMLGSLINKLR
jgi:four helix bundle protein